MKKNYNEIKSSNIITNARINADMGKSRKMECEYKIAIEKYDNVIAMYELSLYYYQIKEYGKMLILLLNAIKKGHQNSMIFLANYEKNNNNIEKFKKYINMAIDRKNIIAMNILADYYKDISNISLMIEYLILAIKYNDTTAMYKLGKYYWYNNDDKNAKKYLKMSADLGDLKSIEEYKLLYCKDDEYLVQKYNTIASLRGDTNAMVEIGDYYIKKNKRKYGVSLYKKAGDKNNTEGLFKYAMYIYEPFSKNIEAYKSLLKCIDIDENYVDAYEILGLICVEKGKINMAKKYLLKGISLKQKDCFYIYSSILCVNILKDYKEGEKYAILGYENVKDLKCCNLLGLIYLKNKDYENMKKYFEIFIEEKNNLTLIFFENEKKNAKKILGNHYQFIECDYEKAEIYYNDFEDKMKRLNKRKENINHILSLCNTTDKNECSLCGEINQNYILSNCCKNILCKKCIIGILNSKINFICPYCRKINKVIHNNIKYDYDEREIDQNYIDGIYFPLEAYEEYED
jgi:TPR repeat protein